MTPADLADLIRQAADSDDAAAVLDDALQELGLAAEEMGTAAWRVMTMRARAGFRAGLTKAEAAGIARVFPAVDSLRRLQWDPRLFPVRLGGPHGPDDFGGEDFPSADKP